MRCPIYGTPIGTSSIAQLQAQPMLPQTPGWVGTGSMHGTSKAQGQTCLGLILCMDFDLSPTAQPLSRARSSSCQVSQPR